MRNVLQHAGPVAAIALQAGLLMVCTPALAASPSSDEAPTEPPPERRNGFMFGFNGGFASGYATGNPSNLSQRDDPNQQTGTGVGAGYRITPFLGGALTDWFQFGFGVSQGQLYTANYRSVVATFLFRVEVFPLYAWGGSFRDLGLGADFGAGGSSIELKAPRTQMADSGVLSSIGANVFWEPWRLWRTAGGPYLAYQRNWSRWYERHDIVLGLRWAFYGGP